MLTQISYIHITVLLLYSQDIHYFISYQNFMLTQISYIHITLLLLDPQDIHLEGKNSKKRLGKKEEEEEEERR